MSTRLSTEREEVQALNLQLQQRRIKRDLVRLDEENAEAERKRAEAVAAEQAHTQAALEQTQLQRQENERQRIEEERQREADERWQQWADYWIEYGFSSLPSLAPNLPHEFVLQIQPAIAESLRTVSPTTPTAIVQQLVLAAIQRVIGPWKRQLDVEKAIKRATQELPLQVRNFSDFFPNIFPPTEWETRAMAAARDAVSHLDGNVSIVEIHATAAAVGRQVASEYAAEQACEREEPQRQRRLRA